MARMAAENIRADRERSLKMALKSKRPIDEIAEDFGMSVDEITALMVEMNGKGGAPDG
jgi:predicted Rossmann fold nucleotide-binding protein DprA/Smf involved in DNA uptake